MMTTREAERTALLRTIIDEPGNDTPRLVYADFLEENAGESERAEFIRNQIRPFDIGMCRQSTCQTAGHGLCSYCRSKKSPSYRLIDYPVDVVCEWRRGLIDTISCSMADFLTHGPAICREHPVSRVTITDRDPWNASGLPGCWRWLLKRPDRDDITDQIPYGIYHEMIGMEERESLSYLQFSSIEDASLALSSACIAWARADS